MNTEENQYTDAQIVDYMQKNPHANVSMIAANLDISTFRVSQAQHNHLKLVLAKCRNSPLWSDKNYTCPGKRRMEKETFYRLLAQINEGELGVYQHACDKYRMCPEYRIRLQEAKAAQ